MMKKMILKRVKTQATCPLTMTRLRITMEEWALVFSFTVTPVEGISKKLSVLNWIRSLVTGMSHLMLLKTCKDRLLKVAVLRIPHMIQLHVPEIVLAKTKWPMVIPTVDICLVKRTTSNLFSYKLTINKV